MDWKDVEKLSHFASSIGLVYIVIGLLSSFGMVYLEMSGEEIPKMVGSAHSHFFCMSTLILILGLGMHNWASKVKEGDIALDGGSLKSAQVAVAFLALGALISFVFLSMQLPQIAMVGYILYTLGFLIVSFGWISSGGKCK